jgi:hypothetical protein
LISMRPVAAMFAPELEVGDWRLEIGGWRLEVGN